MFKRSATVLLEIVGTLVAGIAIAGGGLAWRLSQGPISLDFLTPYVEQALRSPEHGIGVKLDHTLLLWSGWTRPIDLHVIGVHVLDTQGHPLATLPEIAVGFSVRALAHGVLAPTSLEVFGGLAHLRRGAQGLVDLQLSDQAVEQGTPDIVPLLIDDMMQHADPAHPFSYLQSVTIKDADLVIDDSHWDTSWKVRLNELSLERDPAGIHADASLSLVVEGVESGVTATGLYDAAAHNASLDIAFDKLEPAAFTHLAPELAPLARVALPLSGKIDVHFVAGRVLDRVDFEVAGGAGHVSLPEFYDHDLAIDHLEAKGSLTDGGTKLALDHATIELGALSPAGPVKSSPLITVTGSAEGLGGDSHATFDVTGRDFAVDEVPVRWPASIAPHAHEWIAHNLSGGSVEEVHATFALSDRGADLGKIVLDKLGGTMRVEGVDVHYLGKMPAVRNVNAAITFDQKTMTIALDRGTVEGLTLDQGTVVISGLDVKDQAIDIELVIRGPVDGALRLIDYPPLGYASSLGFDPKAVKGAAATRLKLEFPLVHDLQFAQVKVAAASNLDAVEIKNVVLGLDLTDGVLKLRINKEGMSVGGAASLEGTPITLAWDETFGKGKDGRGPSRRIEVKGIAGDGLQTKLALLPEGMVTGPLPTDLVLTRIGGVSRPTQVALDFDLKAATLAPPRFAWRKKPGIAASAHMILDIRGDKLKAIRDLRVDGSGIAARAEIGFDDGGNLSTVTVPEFAFDRTHASGTLARGAGGAYQVSVKGAEFDAAGFLKGSKETQPSVRGPKIAIAVDVGKLWLSDSAKMAFGATAGSLDDDGLHIARASVASKTASGAAVNFQIETTPKGRTLSFASDDAGQALSVLGVIDNMVGGKLKVNGTFDDSKPVAPLAGNFRIDDYRLNNAPFMAKLLTLTSLTGILNQLSGRGIAFSSLVGTFVKTGGLVKIADGRTAGSELGLTFEGAVDLDASTLDINGTVVPIYTLNSLLGNIPILGDILVGPKGGGVFAATYRATGSLDNPDVSVNPLSALAPGILRGLLNIFTPGAAKPGTATPVPAPNAPAPGAPLQAPPDPPAQIPATPSIQSMPQAGTAPTVGGK